MNKRKCLEICPNVEEFEGTTVNGITENMCVVVIIC